MTPVIAIADWRDSVLSALMQRGTPEAYREIECVGAQFPDLKWIKEYTLPATKKIILQKTWKPPTIKHILSFSHSEMKPNSQKTDDREYWYEDHRFYIRLKSNRTFQADFSRSKTLRKMFETFYRLWEFDGKGEYEKQRIIEKYHDLHHEMVAVDKIGHDKSNILSKIIPKEIQNSKRLEWYFDRSKKLWIFRINPLS